MAGRASTPFVVNIVRATARLMDGGHRMQALLMFWQNKVPMKIGEARVYYEQLPEDDRRCFGSRKLQVMEFKNLPLKDEVESYIQLNSGLVFSLGERLHATHSFNPVTKLADEVVKNPENADMIKRLSSLVGRDGTGKSCGRKDDFLTICYLVYHLYFRKRGDSIIPTMAEKFVEAILKFNTDSECKNTSLHEGKTLNECKETVVNLLRRTLQLNNTVGSRAETGQKELRRLVMCMMLVREIQEHELTKAIDENLFANFVSHVYNSKRPAAAQGKNAGGNGLHDILTRNTDIKNSDIRIVVQAYQAFCAKPPPPPPPPPPNP